MAEDEGAARAPRRGVPGPKKSGPAGAGKKKRRRRLYKAAEVVERSEVTRAALQQYVAMGLIEEAARNEAGQALYDESVLVRVKLIRDLNDTGYTLRDIRDIFFR